MKRLAGVLVLAGCGAGSPAPAVPGEGNDVEVTASIPEDSLALVTRAGAELWFVVGRGAVGADGIPCYERGLEIRDAEGRRGVPLLYTLTAPTVLDDTSVRAVVSNRCRPGDAYRVSLRTGRPTPLGGR